MYFNLKFKPFKNNKLDKKIRRRFCLRRKIILFTKNTKSPVNTGLFYYSFLFKVSLIKVDPKIKIPPITWNIVIFSPKNRDEIRTAVIGSI